VNQLDDNKRNAREDVDNHTLVKDRPDVGGERARFLLALSAP
jgi:hypothetical protein